MTASLGDAEPVADLQARLADVGYLAGRPVATAVHLGLALGQPVLLEGEAGVGKTELAKALALVLDRPLVRLQCYEGIEASQALYEWDYARQLVHLRSLRDGDVPTDVFSERFIVERPLLTAVRAAPDCVLLIDEVDRADEEFEAFLLELLSDFQVTVPELGTIRAAAPPPILLTSNRTRELHDALRRRCLYCWIDFPDEQRELDIVRVRAPDVQPDIAVAVTAAARRVRELDLVKRPGVAETIAWARATAAMGGRFDPAAADETLGAVVKDRDDLALVRQRLDWVVDGVATER